MIRTARIEDGAAFAAIYAPHVEEGYVSFEEVAPGAGEMARRVEGTLGTHPWLAVEEGGVAVGYAYAGPHRSRAGYRWAVDVAIYLAPEACGRGYGRRLYAALFDILVAQGYTAAFAGIALPNAASVGLHEAMGFQSVGVCRNVGFKAGAWRDVGWWSRELAPLEAPPSEPVPFADLHRV